MGVDNNGRTLYRPNGSKLITLPYGFKWLASVIQRKQHRIAQKTWTMDIKCRRCGDKVDSKFLNGYIEYDDHCINCIRHQKINSIL